MTIALCRIHEELPQSLISTPRIKQLKSISGRHFEKLEEVKDLFGIYYTLTTTNEEEKEFFKSNIIKNSLNPSWNPLDRLMFPSWINEQSSDFIIKVWFISGNDFDNPILLFTNKIEGKLLVYIGTELTVLKSEFSKNSLIFEYTNGYYIQCSECSELRKESINTINVYKVDNSQVKKSYSADMLINLNKIQEEIKNERKELEKKKNAIREKLKTYKENHYLDMKKAEHKEESTIVENQLVISMLNIEETTQRIEEFRNSNITKRAELNKKIEDYNNQMEELENEKKEFEHEMTQKNNHIQFMRYQRLAELVHDLLDIYPIEPSLSDPLIYTIGGIALPNSRYEGYNPDDISTALGYTCHLITVIADYIDVVLRYPIKSMSSRSTIVDPLSKDCQPLNEFPLFTKKLNDGRFIYGVFLLNKNIEQLLNHIKQNVSNLRNTLPNLRKLLYKIIQLGSSDSKFVNESFSESANLNNKCFQHVIQSFDNDSHYYCASSVGSSSNYYSSSTYNPNYPYYSNTPVNSNISNSNIGNNSFINNNNNNSNSNSNINNNNSALSPILSYNNNSYTGITGINTNGSTSLYSQPAIFNSSIYSTSFQSPQTISEVNVSSILSRSYINKKNYNNMNK